MDRIRRILELSNMDMDIGNGVVVGVLDSGVDGTHPDLRGKIMDYHDFIRNDTVISDEYGHGTHVCGCIGGTGLASHGKFRGIAPKTGFVVGKVLDENGDGKIQAMEEGIQWMIGNAKKYHIRVLNISVGAGNFYDVEEFRRILSLLENAWNQGIMVVCAAGNRGMEENALSKIAGERYTLAVGCHEAGNLSEKEGACQKYSSIGMTFADMRKPDLVAPGSRVVSCNRLEKRRKSYYCRKSGTSMATAIVSGCIALYFQKNRSHNNEFCRQKLLSTCTDLGEPWEKQGYGWICPKLFLE